MSGLEMRTGGGGGVGVIGLDIGVVIKIFGSSVLFINNA